MNNKNRSFCSVSIFALMISAEVSAQDFAATSGPKVTCSSLVELSLPNTEILSATETSSPSAHCNVVGVIDKRVSQQDPDHFIYGIGFELNLPDRWEGRFEMMGGGGTDGSLRNPLGFFGSELASGWAVATDDGGHEDVPGNPLLGWIDDDPNAGGTAHFAVDEQARIDYGYHGIEKTTQISKAIITAYYGIGARHSYLCGCSNGGRDAMVASQREPDVFDGIVAGNPGFDLPRAAVAEAWNEVQLAPLATHTDANGQPYVADTFPYQDLEVASAAILSACDALDGLVDGIVDNYTECTNRRVHAAFDEYTCRADGSHGNTPHGGTCLTAAQVTALKNIYGGARNSSGEPLYSSWFWDAGIWDPFSAFGAGFGAWNIALPGPPGATNTAINLTLGAGAVPMIFTTPPVVTPVQGTAGQEAFIFNYNFDTDAPKIFSTAPGYPQSSMDFMTANRFMNDGHADLTPFARHGGKMIIYDSINDGIFSAVDLVNWYDSLVPPRGEPEGEGNRRDGNAGDYIRLYLVPNMAHCGGGPATDSFGANVLTAITSWVERDSAPGAIVAANTSTSSPFPTGAPFDPQVAQNFPTGGTRPLCPYPRQARYSGTGATNDAANFTCVNPGDPHPDLER
jgi:hypothetical protein